MDKPSPTSLCFNLQNTLDSITIATDGIAAISDTLLEDANHIEPNKIAALAGAIDILVDAIKRRLKESNDLLTREKTQHTFLNVIK